MTSSDRRRFYTNKTENSCAARPNLNSCSASVLHTTSIDRFFPKSDMLGLEFSRFITFLRRVEFAILELYDQVHHGYVWIWSHGDFGLRLLWYTLHLILNAWYFILGSTNALESYLISGGVIKKYRDPDISKVKYLAIVIESEEARQTLKVLELLRWLDAIGLRNVCLYDMEGVLKNSKEALTLWLKSEIMSNALPLVETASNSPIVEPKYMCLEVISFSDSKLAVAKAANVLLKKNYLNANGESPKLAESDMTDALAEIGYDKPEPDLLLVYGRARCHLGFPAWRLRYTEIVHMGPLKSMKFGSLMKAIHRFTTVRQNYGT